MRLIDADALKTEMVNDLANTMRMTEMHKGDMAIRVLNKIDEAHTIEAEPVRHGEWIHVEGDEYLCSACKIEFTIEDFDSVVTNYCPNCGAKMDGGKQDADAT